MRRILFCVLFGIMTSAPLRGAQDQSSPLTSLSELSRRGQLPQLIQTANSLLAYAKLTPTQEGVVLTYLGHAYQQGGDFTRATACYEKALAIFERDREHSEYATTLGTLATLYAETGQIATAKHVLLRSIHLYEKDGEHHAEIAMIWNDLATLAADERSSREAHKCMAHSIAESQLTTKITSDETAALTATQARIAELDGDPQTAITDYQQSLTLWKQSHEDQHPDTGWLYVLLGDAYLRARDIADARQTTAHGLSILKATSGPQSQRYLNAELVYANVLDASGDSGEASKLRKDAEAALHTGSDRQHAQGQVSIYALR